MSIEITSNQGVLACRGKNKKIAVKGKEDIRITVRLVNNVTEY